MSETFAIINRTKGKLPGLPFEAMKNEALGPDYDLELIFVSEEESHKLNLDYREKDKPANVLSFPLAEKAGQIFISPDFAKKEAPNFDRTYENYLAFLFIHGVIHLKGFDHGSRMESEERKIREKFGI